VWNSADVFFPFQYLPQVCWKGVTLVVDFRHHKGLPESWFFSIQLERTSPVHSRTSTVKDAHAYLMKQLTGPIQSVSKWIYQTAPCHFDNCFVTFVMLPSLNCSRQPHHRLWWEAFNWTLVCIWGNTVTKEVRMCRNAWTFADILDTSSTWWVRNGSEMVITSTFVSQKILMPDA